MTATLISYARCSTDRQDLTAQREILQGLGVDNDRVYLDHGLTGIITRRRPGLDQALAAVRAGDSSVDTLDDIIAAAERGIHRIRHTHHLPFSFCATAACPYGERAFGKVLGALGSPPDPGCHRGLRSIPTSTLLGGGCFAFS
jgi:Resolvase, N terminal domain